MPKVWISEEEYYPILEIVGEDDGVYKIELSEDEVAEYRTARQLFLNIQRKMKEKKKER